MRIGCDAWPEGLMILFRYRVPNDPGNEVVKLTVDD